jgi:hypothetical protein
MFVAMAKSKILVFATYAKERAAESGVYWFRASMTVYQRKLPLATQIKNFYFQKKTGDREISGHLFAGPALAGFGY